MNPFPELHVLYVTHGDLLVGVFYHPNAAALVTKQEEIEAMKNGWDFRSEVYDLRQAAPTAESSPEVKAVEDVYEDETVEESK